jgi:dTDP-4-dehydrorhamnose 3,5-epimerase
MFEAVTINMIDLCKNPTGNWKIESVYLGAVVVLLPKIYKDDRGFFMEEFRADQFSELGLPAKFQQQNHSGSLKNVIRGLHFQWDPPMGKLMRVLKGKAFLVAVDIRKNSPTLGQWVGIEASDQDRKQIWAPPGFARGFGVLSDYAEIQYMCTATYNPKGESGIRWNDPEIGIDWPIANPTLSDKDGSAQTLSEWLSSNNSNNFHYTGADRNS